MSTAAWHCPDCGRNYDELVPEPPICIHDGTDLKRASQAATPDPTGPVPLTSDLQDRYEVLDQIGEGGMGIVYRARQRSLGRMVAMKVIRPDRAMDAQYVKRFLREVKVTSQLGHPNVVTVHDYGTMSDGRLFLVEELLDAETLDDRIQQGPISSQRAVAIAAQMCDGLEAAHKMSIVHRDMKPQNVCLQSGAGPMGDFVKLLDFGLARPMGGSSVMAITRTGQICGTPAYMSPEQVRGEEATPASDIYAVGLIVYEMLTGTLPFQMRNVSEALTAHLHETPRSLEAALPSVPWPPALEDAIAAALEKDPNRRPPTVDAFKRLLRSAVGQRPTNPQMPVVGREAGDRGLTRSLMIAGLLILVTTLGFWSVLQYTEDGESTAQTVAAVSGAPDPSPNVRSVTPALTTDLAQLPDFPDKQRLVAVIAKLGVDWDTVWANSYDDVRHRLQGERHHQPRRRSVLREIELRWSSFDAENVKRSQVRLQLGFLEDRLIRLYMRFFTHKEAAILSKSLVESLGPKDKFASGRPLESSTWYLGDHTLRLYEYFGKGTDRGFAITPAGGLARIKEAQAAAEAK